MVQRQEVSPVTAVRHSKTEGPPLPGATLLDAEEPPVEHTQGSHIQDGSVSLDNNDQSAQRQDAMEPLPDGGTVYQYDHPRLRRNESLHLGHMDYGLTMQTKDAYQDMHMEFLGGESNNLQKEREREERDRKQREEKREREQAEGRQAPGSVFNHKTGGGTTQEELNNIKARTMHNMVEELSGNKKLLFLTNSQAATLASSGETIQKMLDSLDLPKPKLVINLLMSLGSTEYCKIKKESWEGARCEDGNLGMIHGRGPFKDAEEDRKAMSKLDRFMQDVLIPLAADTNAVIICCAVPQLCALTRSILRMVGLIRPKWGAQLPFSIVAISTMADYYFNTDNDAKWKSIKSQSKIWQARHTKIEQLLNQKYTNSGWPELAIDLDTNASCLILVDSIDMSKDSGRGEILIQNEGLRLKNELVRHLASTLPSLTIKSLGGSKKPLDEALWVQSGLGVALESMLSGSPLVFLDIRERKPLDCVKAFKDEKNPLPFDRAKLIKEAMDMYNQSCDDLLFKGLVETFETCSIAYFHEILEGDGDVDTTDSQHRARKHMPIWEAIKYYSSQAGSAGERTSKHAATDKQVEQVATWLAKRTLDDVFKLLPEDKKQPDEGEVYESAEDMFKAEMDALVVQMITFFKSPNLHHLNLAGQATGMKDFIDELVNKDRIPTQNTLEELKLLQRAWNEHDIAVYLAGRYKFAGKALFVLQSLVAWGIIFFGSANFLIVEGILASRTRQHILVVRDVFLVH